MANLKNHDTSGLRPPWKPGESGNPKGRPRNSVSKLLTKVMPLTKVRKYTGLTADEVRSWETALMSLHIDEITSIAKEPEIPTYVRGLALAILSDAKNGKTTTLARIRDRVYGKETQKLEVTGANGVDLIPAKALTKDEAKELWEAMDKDF